MNTTKEIAVNGVYLRLHKLSAFEQYEMMDLLYPVAVEVIGSLSPQVEKLNESAFVGAIVAKMLKSLPSEMRHKLIFGHLLSERSVKLFINGAELQLIGKSENNKSIVMSQDLADISDLLEIAGEAFKFNFERFFEKLLQLKAQKLK